MSLLKEKIGYGFGDMSSSMFWKIFSYYLPIFYSNIFGLSLVDAGILVLVTRIWDAVSDPMMGVCADRTHTRWGIAPTCCGWRLLSRYAESFCSPRPISPTAVNLSGHMSLM